MRLDNGRIERQDFLPLLAYSCASGMRLQDFYFCGLRAPLIALLACLAFQGLSQRRVSRRTHALLREQRTADPASGRQVRNHNMSDSKRHSLLFQRQHGTRDVVPSLSSFPFLRAAVISRAGGPSARLQGRKNSQSSSSLLLVSYAKLDTGADCRYV
jgi:hypothetical protein